MPKAKSRAEVRESLKAERRQVASQARAKALDRKKKEELEREIRSAIFETQQTHCLDKLAELITCWEFHHLDEEVQMAATEQYLNKLAEKTDRQEIKREEPAAPEKYKDWGIVFFVLLIGTPALFVWMAVVWGEASQRRIQRPPLPAITSYEVLNGRCIAKSSRGHHKRWVSKVHCENLEAAR